MDYSNKTIIDKIIKDLTEHIAQNKDLTEHIAGMKSNTALIAQNKESYYKGI